VGTYIWREVPGRDLQQVDPAHSKVSPALLPELVLGYATRIALTILPANSILHFTAIIATVSESFRAADPSDPTSQRPSEIWLTTFQKLLTSVRPTFHEVTSHLSMISAAISTGKPLPPFLDLEKVYHLGRLLEEQDVQILSTRNVCEPGYSVFAVMEVATRMLAHDLEGLLRETKILVGEVALGSADVVPYEDLEGDLDPMGVKEE
jgi:hypothetical protein